VIQKRTRLAAWSLVIAMAAALVVALPAGAAPPSGAGAAGGLRSLGKADVRALAGKASAARLQQVPANGPEIRAPRAPKVSKAGSGPRLPIPDAANVPVRPGRGGARGFDGISHADQRLAFGGNQFSKEPPDGAVCHGNGAAVELVNGGVQFFTGDGVLLTPTLAASEFYGLPPEIDRTTDPATFPGPFLGDPRCTFDVGSGRLFLIYWGTGQDPVTGEFTGENVFYIAVSATEDPLGAYHRYALEVSPPGSPGCVTACLADFPTAATDANSYVLSYNEFGLTDTGFEFNVAKILVLSKAQLVAGTGGPVELREAPRIGGVPPFAIQGGIVPPGGAYETGGGGTLWMLSTLDFDETGAKRLGLLAITNTSAIDRDPGAIAIRRAVVPGVLPHRPPPKARQRPGPRPLGESVGEPQPRRPHPADQVRRRPPVDGGRYPGRRRRPRPRRPAPRGAGAALPARRRHRRPGRPPGLRRRQGPRRDLRRRRGDRRRPQGRDRRLPLRPAALPVGGVRPAAARPGRRRAARLPQGRGARGRLHLLRGVPRPGRDRAGLPLG
jgi:hypothetical protein